METVQVERRWRERVDSSESRLADAYRLGNTLLGLEPDAEVTRELSSDTSAGKVAWTWSANGRSVRAHQWTDGTTSVELFLV